MLKKQCQYPCNIHWILFRLENISSLSWNFRTFIVSLGVDGIEPVIWYEAIKSSRNIFRTGFIRYMLSKTSCFTIFCELRTGGCKIFFYNDDQVMFSLYECQVLKNKRGMIVLQHVEIIGALILLYIFKVLPHLRCSMVFFFKQLNDGVFFSGRHRHWWFFNAYATPWPPLNVFYWRFKEFRVVIQADTNTRLLYLLQL